MITVSEFRTLALASAGASEAAHFERIAFKVKKIFATLDAKSEIACLMLSPVDQSVFCSFDSRVIYPVPNKWGKQGATYVVLKKVRKDMLRDMLKQAHAKCIGKPGKTKRS